MEVIVVDDGSTDNTKGILGEYQVRDPRVRVESFESNRGLTHALIRGCELARGAYIARQDVGDFSLPERLEKEVALLDSTPGAAFVSCGYRVVGPRGELLQEVPGCDGDLATQVLREASPERLAGPHHGTVMFRKSAYETAGGYREDFYYTQDLDLWTRMVEIGSFACVPDLLYEVGFTYDSISARHLPKQQRLKALIAEAMQLRRAGEPEDSVLRRAAMIRPGAKSGESRIKRDADAAYFVGSCLTQRGDPAAVSYLREVVGSRPWHLKAWVKLARSVLRSGRATEAKPPHG